MNLLDKFISYLTPGHLEGIVLYLISMTIVTAVHVKFRKEWAEGLKGINGHWEGPEILLYICMWVLPCMIFADIFLGLHASDIVWYSVISFVFFGLTGRFGLEWLLAFRSGASQVTSTTIVEKKTETTQEVK